MNSVAQGEGFVGRYVTYPDKTKDRRAEGGRRLNGVVRESRSDAPLVTIVTVCWNSAKTIEQTIRSVFGQTYHNIEYIIVDGASDDGTLDIIQRYEDQIDYFVSEPDEGLYFAMNKGLELAQGDFILLLNSDDWYTVDAVELLLDAKDYSGCDFVSALAQLIDETGAAVQTLRPMPFNDSQYIRMSVRHETMLISKNLYNRLGPYDTNYRIIADLELTRRLFKAGATHYELTQPLLNFRTTGVSSTENSKLLLETEQFLEAEFPFLNNKEKRQLADNWAIGPKRIIEICNAHIDKPKFVRACRALLADRKRYAGQEWRETDLSVIGATDQLTFPLVSVIIPFYAAEDYFCATLDSVLAQNLREVEVICVNDCAIDDTQTIVENYRRRDPRVRTLINQHNLGPGASRNKGVAAARGQYVLFLDADDTLPSDALQKLYDVATQFGSTMVRGAIKVGQGVHGQALTKEVVNYPCGVSDRIVPNVQLATMPELLRTTEGHTTYLYEADFVRAHPYPTDLRVGEDSLFLIRAICSAQAITLIPEIVYHYRANPLSAMNKFTSRMYFDALEWRTRAWKLLNDAGQQSVGENLLFNYWNKGFFDRISQQLPPPEIEMFFEALGRSFLQAGYPGAVGIRDPHLRSIFDAAVRKVEVSSKVAPNRRERLSGVSGRREASLRNLNVATLVLWDYGGAGQGSQRRVEALRRNGVNAEIYCVFKNTNKPHVRQAPLIHTLDIPDGDAAALNAVWRANAVVTEEDAPILLSRELFSKTGAIVDFDKMSPIIDRADIVHLHWVAGMLDYKKAPNYLSDKPVVWTLADMNAFTGGCHYSEGCEGFKRECRACPLLGGSDLAHEHWKTKKRAYDALQCLHIICPSQWLADRASESSLFRGRPIHVIPNALPVDRFTPTNKLIARHKLGLPFDKKLVIFGAANQKNARKGGDILAASMELLVASGRADNVEGVFFGSSALEIGIKGHNMGHVTNEEKLSLLYAAADAYAFPSREDNAPLTVAEAMLSGTPVVAFSVGNVPELVQHKQTGYIAHYEDAADFAEGLAWVLAQPRSTGALARSIRCRTAASAHNDPNRAARTHIELYRSIKQ